MRITPYVRAPPSCGVRAAHDAPRRIDRDPFGRFGLAGRPHQEVAQYPFVLRKVEGTGAVQQQSAGTQGPPRFAQNTSLPFGAQRHAGLAPLRARLLQLAEHPLARAGRIDRHRVEPPFETGDLRRIVDRHGHVAHAPFTDIVGQHGGTVADDLVRYDQPAAPRKRRIEGRLPSRSGAQIEHASAPDSAARRDDMTDELRRRLLHIVASCVKIGVERKRRTGIEPVSPRAPTDRTAGGCGESLGRIEPHRNGRFARQRTAQRAALVRTQFAQDAFDEFRRQHRQRFCSLRSRSIRRQIFSNTAGFSTKSSVSLSTRSTSPS